MESIADGISGITYHYTYDRLHRLTSETTTGNVPDIITDGYVMTFGGYEDPGPIHGVRTISLDTGLAANDYIYAYDANGNTTSSTDFTDPLNPAARSLIQYNADNMPTSIAHAGNGVTTILYDGDNVRAKKTAGTTSTYYFDKYYEVEATGGSLDAIHYIFAGDTRIALKKNAGKRFFHNDHLKSTTVVTGTELDASQAIIVLQKTLYRPYGSDSYHFGNETDYKFTDQEQDTSTGLYNYDARLYDPMIGMFNIPDTLLPDIYDPQQLNRYAYCRNNPLKYTDPTGHVTARMDFSVTAGAGGAVTGGRTIEIDDNLNVAVSDHVGGGGFGGATASGSVQIGATTADTVFDTGNGIGASTGVGVSVPGTMLGVTGETVIGDGYMGGQFGLTIGPGTPVEMHGVVEASKISKSFNIVDEIIAAINSFLDNFKDKEKAKPEDTQTPTLNGQPSTPTQEKTHEETEGDPTTDSTTDTTTDATTDATT